MAYDDIQDQIDQGRQQAADELGPPHDVYRLSGSQDGSGNVLTSSNQIASLVSIYTKVAYGGMMRQALESEKQQGIMWYDVIADMSPFRVGDIFVVNDPVYGQGHSRVNFSTTDFKGFALADHSPIKKALGGRLNCTVTISRPKLGPNTSKQFDRTKTEAAPVQLSGGTFSLGTVGGVAAKIPAGLIAQGRTYGDQVFEQSPAEKRRSGWELYLPALKGFEAREGDHITGPDGARYVLIIPYNQKVGASGTQWFLEREAPGP